MNEPRSNTPWILIAVLIVIFCGGGLFVAVGALVFSTTTGPVTVTAMPYAAGGGGIEEADAPFRGVLRKFKRALVDGDHATAYGLLTDGYRQDVSLEQFIAQCNEMRADDLTGPDSLELGEFQLIEPGDATDPTPRSGLWTDHGWSTDGRTERLHFEEVEPGVWRISSWNVGE